jgi:phage terminase small subunit
MGGTSRPPDVGTGNRFDPYRFYLTDRHKVGDRRKPTAALKLHSDLRACHHGDRSREPQPTGKPVKPPTLTGAAGAHWNAVVPSLIETGVATAQDTPALTRLCEFWGEYERTRDSEPKDRKRLLMMVTAHRQWIDLASRFGLTPSDRARIVSDGKDKARSKTASHLA